MSLSRFYKNNNDFQAKSVLENAVVVNDEPVWGSIVTEDITVPEENMADVPTDSQQSSISPKKVEEPDSSPPPEQQVEPPIAEPVVPPQPETTIDIETIEQNAFLSGIEAGRKQAEDDFENSAQTLMCICQELDALRETILKNSVGEMKELVLAISEKIIRHSVTEQDKTIIATINDAINLAVKSDEFQIQLNPEDLAAVETKKKEIIDSISELENIVLKADPTIERGGCLLESTCCTVDASMIGQIKVVHDSIIAKDVLTETKSSTEPDKL
jgi:flagellar assembly protein FliH